MGTHPIFESDFDCLTEQMGNERAPLLSQSSNPPSYDSIINDSYDVTFTGSSPRRIPAIDCRVCHATIDCTGRTQQHVVRCTTCNETTPLKAAPAGKRYIRCNCNCLLICTENAVRVACPRCRRHIRLGVAVNPVNPTAPVSAQLRCSRCRSEFSHLYPLRGTTRCPSCDTKLHLDPRTLKKKIFYFCWLFTALFAAGAIAMVCGFVRNGNEFNFADPIAFIMFAFYATSIIVIFIGLVISCRNQVARVIEYNHT